MNTNTTGSDLIAFDQLLGDRNLVSYFLVASAVLLLYDWLLMFPTELEFIWAAKLRPFSVIYLLQRYMPFIDTAGILFAVEFVAPIHPNTCRILYDISGWMYITGIALTEVVLTMRTWALWGRNFKLTIGLPIFFVCCWVPNFYVFHKFLSSQTYMPSPFPNEIGCVILGGQPVLFLCWVILMIYEAGILILMLFPGLTFCAFFADFNAHVRQSAASVRHNSDRWSALTNVVYRDGITYYIYLFVLSAVNVIVILSLSHALENLFSPPQRVIQTLLTSRAILHIRSQSRKRTILVSGADSGPSKNLEIHVTQEQLISGIEEYELEELSLLPTIQRDGIMV